jgi:hypothetical protein
MMQFSDKLFYMVLNPPLSLSVRIPVLFLFRLMPFICTKSVEHMIINIYVAWFDVIN